MEWLDQLNALLWGPPMLVAILGTGLVLTVYLGFLPLRKLGFAFRQLRQGRRGQGTGDITPFNALMTALSATIGTGNIVGVATAVGIGGPGALFWMWLTALVGMATKYSEAVLAVHFRETDDRGRHVGGPMYYIRNGLGKNWAWLGFLFAVFGMLAGFGIGNSVQSNAVADALHASIGIPEIWTGLILTLLVGTVLLGGIQRIAEVAGALVPFMAGAYLLVGLLVIALHIQSVPAAIWLIVEEAFTPTAATGGFAGAGIMLALQMGVARGIFSNEAGLGSAPIAHAASEIDSPVRQGSIAMLGTFIDTLVVCTITGLVLVLTGAWQGAAQGAEMTAYAFDSVLPHGHLVVSIALPLFAFTTMLGWSYYGERCAQFLFGSRVIVPFRALWLVAIFIGSFQSLDLVWKLADTLNAMMALPNLLALLLLSPLVVKLSKAFFAGRAE